MVASGVPFRSRAARLCLPELLVLGTLALGLTLPTFLRGELIGRYGISHEYSLFAFVDREVRTGRLPVWNPYTVSGNPGLADPAANVFYPSTVPLLRLFGETAAIDFTIVIHMVLAGGLMLLYLGSLRLPRPARFVGAAVYMLSGFEAWRALAGDIPRLLTFAWIPLLFYLVEEITAGRQRMGAALLGGLVLAAQVFAGDPQTFVYASLALVAYAAARVTTAARQDPSGARTAARCVTAMLMLGAGLAAVQWLPTLEQFFHSNRAGFGPGFAYLGSIPPLGLVSLIAPRFFGDEVHGWWGERELAAPEFYPHAASLYTGFFTVVLIIAALTARSDRWHVRFFAVLGVAVLWLALGKFGYLYRAVTFIPFLRSFRDIENINILVPICASVLAAAGFDAFLEPGVPASVWRRTLTSLGLVVAAAAGLVALTVVMQLEFGVALLALPAVRAPIVESAAFVLAATVLSVFLIRARARHAGVPGWWIVSALAFLLADLLYAAGPLVTAGTDIRPMARPDAITRYLAQDRSVYRVSGFYDRGPLFGVQDTGGEPSLLLARYQEYTDVLQGRPPSGYPRPEGPHGVAIRTGFDSPLLDLLNVKYVIARAADLRAAHVRDASALVEVSPGTFIYRKARALPRLYAPRGYRVIHDRGATLDVLARSEYNPYAAVVLDRRPEFPTGAETAAGGRPARLRLLSYDDNRVVVKAEFTDPGLLVLADLYYPAWTADLDGRPVAVYRADYLFRAVAVPAGSHVVRFLYRDRALAWGAVLSVASMGAGVAAWGLDRAGRRAPFR
ncbi:MAG TPA: hypothetical protein VJT33_11785 [bacterium]|nr:hypothetical protein [bacterium]